MCLPAGFARPCAYTLGMSPQVRVHVSGRNANRTLPLPAPVVRAIQKLGEDISLARRRRRMSQASLAERIGASLSTVRRMEGGDARVPLHFIARMLQVFGELGKLSHLLDTASDEIGLTLVDAQLPKRIRTKRSPPGTQPRTPPGAL